VVVFEHRRGIAGAGTPAADAFEAGCDTSSFWPIQLQIPARAYMM
jgi:hypothetical protein